MSDPRLELHRRNLPHWTVDGGVYFVTFRLAKGSLDNSEQGIVFEHLKEGDGTFYVLAAAVVMPDHAHLLLKPKPEFKLSRIMKGIKGVTARKINLLRGESGTIWQDESWDRIIRDAEEFQEKLNYMADNPVNTSLVRAVEDYPFWFCNKELCL